MGSLVGFVGFILGSQPSEGGQVTFSRPTELHPPDVTGRQVIVSVGQLYQVVAVLTDVGPGNDVAMLVDEDHQPADGEGAIFYETTVPFAGLNSTHLHSQHDDLRFLKLLNELPIL